MPLTVTIDGYDAMLDLDLSEMIVVRRAGAGIALCITRDRVQVCRRVFSRVARILSQQLSGIASKAAVYG